MERVVQKKLKEIFKDFNFNSNILNSKIQCINLYKKTSKLEIKINIMMQMIFSIENEILSVMSSVN